MSMISQTDTGSRAQRIIRRAELVKVSGFCISQIYAMIAEGKFPAPIKLGERASGWLESEVAAWQQARVAERDAKIPSA